MGKIKGWTKVTRPKSLIAWRSERMINPNMHKSTVHVGNPLGEEWSVTYYRHDIPSSQLIHTSTSKDSAVKAAVDFMRRHPNG